MSCIDWITDFSFRLDGEYFEIMSLLQAKESDDERRVPPYYGVDQADESRSSELVVERHVGSEPLDIVIDDAAHFLWGNNDIQFHDHDHGH